jgi:flagellin FlaB
MIQLSKDEDRGQVGIGTLIVFIAMVLVAAIAAGVLINTAGFLQTQASDTGQESTQQVADALTVQSSVGEVGSQDGNISKVRMSVQPAAGADDINLAGVTLQWVADKPDGSTFANIVVGNDTDTGQAKATGQSNPDNINASEPGEDQFGLNVTKAENPKDVVMSDESDRYEIIVPLNDTKQENLAKLPEGTEVEVKLTTGTGSQTTVFMQVPESLSAEEDGDVVNI